MAAWMVPAGVGILANQLAGKRAEEQARKQVVAHQFATQSKRLGGNPALANAMSVEQYIEADRANRQADAFKMAFDAYWSNRGQEAAAGDQYESNEKARRARVAPAERSFADRAAASTMTPQQRGMMYGR